MNKQKINNIYIKLKVRYQNNEDKILIMNIVKHTLELVMNSDKIKRGYLEQSENIFSDCYVEYNTIKKEKTLSVLWNSAVTNVGEKDNTEINFMNIAQEFINISKKHFSKKEIMQEINDNYVSVSFRGN